MRKIIIFTGIIALAALTGFLITGCNIIMPDGNLGDGTDDDFVPVTNIIGVYSTVAVGTVSLGGRVVPSDATNQTINWSIRPMEDDIEGTISGNKLTTTKEGDITVRATIKDGKAKGVNFSKDFYITVEPFVAVSYIEYDGPTNEEVGDIYLDANVYPDDASYTDIVWSIRNAGTTKATINGVILTTKAKGTVVVRATIFNGASGGKDYTQDYSISIYVDNDPD